MTQFVLNVLSTMRLAVGRRNKNDPDSSDTTFLQYLNDFINLTMTEDLKIFEQWGTLSFPIDENNTTGVYTFNDVGASDQFSNITNEAFITLTDPPEASISWNRLEVYQDPGQFFDLWGVNNSEILIPGYPTQMLYFGTEFTFRTIPDTGYTIIIYGYKVVPVFAATADEIPFDYWMRYLAYGAAMNYARDFRFESETRAMLERDFAHERQLLLTRTHNQIKRSRSMPRF